jgi:hypothetical protein
MADYYSAIASAVSRSTSPTDGARGAIYGRARTAQAPLLATEQAALEAAVCRLEADLVSREAS